MFEPSELEGWLEGLSASDGASPEGNFTDGWAAVRDANIRPYVDWLVAPPVSLPVFSAKPSHQPRGVRRVSTMALILSVTEPKVYPGPMTGGAPGGAC